MTLTDNKEKKEVDNKGSDWKKKLRKETINMTILHSPIQYIYLFLYYYFLQKHTWKYLYYISKKSISKVYSLYKNGL